MNTAREANVRPSAPRTARQPRNAGYNNCLWLSSMPPLSPGPDPVVTPGGDAKRERR